MTVFLTVFFEKVIVATVTKFAACKNQIGLVLFSCEEAALEVQSQVCLSSKLNIIKNRLFEVYTKPVYCAHAHSDRHFIIKLCANCFMGTHTLDFALLELLP